MASRTIRDSRESETREAEARPAYTPSSTLPQPFPQAGYSFRWIRTSSFGQADNRNVSARIREGWEPVKSEDHPELQITSDRDTSFWMRGSRWPAACKTATENVTARKEYYEKHAQSR